MRTSLVLSVSKGLLSSFMKTASTAKPAAAAETDECGLSKEQQDKLKGKLALLRKEERKPTTDLKLRGVHEDDDCGDDFMDSIRARGFLKSRAAYSPPANVEVLVRATAQNYDSLNSDPKEKTKVLNKLGAELRHFVPNSHLHKMKTTDDIIAFYRTEVKNLTKFSEIARKENLPSNLNIREHAARFHPNDIRAPHGGVTAFPGTGGEVFGLRNKRLLRQFNPKKEWFDYEDMSFDYDKVDKDMPWDPEIAKRMDSFVDKKFNIKTRSFNKTSS